MPKQKVIRLSDITNNSFQVSAEQAIKDLQEFLETDKDFDKVFLIAVSTKGGEFNYSWFKGKITCSDAVVALNLAAEDQMDILRFDGKD